MNVDFAEPFGPCSRISLFGPPSCTKLRSDPVDLVLDRLLAEQAILAAGPRRVEQVEAADLAPRVLHLRGAVVVEAVDDVLRRARAAGASARRTTSSRYSANDITRRLRVKSSRTD